MRTKYITITSDLQPPFIVADSSSKKGGSKCGKYAEWWDKNTD